MTRVWRDRRLLVALATLVAAVVAMRYSAAGVPALAPVAGILQEVMQPLERATYRAAVTVRQAGARVATLGRLNDENKRLTDKVRRLELLESQVEELRQENIRFRQMLDFQRTAAAPASQRLLAAQVTGRNPDSWFRYVTVNKGSRHKVRKDAVVLTPRGLVGRVSRTTPHGSQVMLLTDPLSGVSAMVQRASSRAPGVVLGQAERGDLLRMKFFLREADVRVGDRIVTSGWGEVFPPGIPIGTVTKVSDDVDGLVRYAWVRPLADLNRMEEVLILVPAQ